MKGRQMPPKSVAVAVVLAPQEILERAKAVGKATREPVSRDVNQEVNLRVHAFIGIGANLGDARATVSKACRDVGQLPGTKLVKQSSLYTSAPYEASGPDFVNAVVEISTGLSPQSLLDHLHQLEAKEARQRPYRNAPRTLDLDVLLYGDQKIQTPTLTVPHPRMNERAFVLVPLAETAPERVSAAQLMAVGNQVICRLT
jgi:2-amino-4-hydroxy-6-hydroxymethyldihydropteridine diphosphokinase